MKPGLEKAGRSSASFSGADTANACVVRNQVCTLQVHTCTEVYVNHLVCARNDSLFKKRRKATRSSDSSVSGATEGEVEMNAELQDRAHICRSHH